VREFVLTDEGLTAMLTTVFPHLDERQRRILAGSTARSLGRPRPGRWAGAGLRVWRRRRL